MLVHDKTCAAITRQVKEGMGDGNQPDRLEAQRQLLLQLADEQAERKTRKKWLISLPVAASLIAALILWFVLKSAAPLPYQIESQTGIQNGAVHPQWISARIDTKHIRFAQGSVFTLAPSSGARIVTATEELVAIDLTRGTLRAKIHGNGQTIWRVHAGPYTTTVVGTEFNVRWSPENEAFNLSVAAGRVEVTGPALNPNGITVAAGENFHINGRKYALTTADTLQSGMAVAAIPAKHENNQGATSAASEITAPLKKTNPTSFVAPIPRLKHKEQSITSTEQWKTLLSQKQYEQAIGAAREAGMDRILNSASAQDLWRLAVAARNVRAFELSTQTLLKLRERFPDARQTPLAAFIIGRTQMDNNGNAARASVWFNTYLKEAAKGAMAEESYGRLMTCYQRLGQPKIAADVATAYLKYYPNGLYRDKADTLLQQIETASDVSTY